MDRFARIIGAVVLVLSIVPMPARAETKVVFMSNLRFCNSPVCVANENVTIKRGDTVQWVYADAQCVALIALGCTHNATGSGGIGSGTMGPTTQKFNHEETFNTAGTFAYVCTVHASQMNAAVVVTN